jgi:hypothetical protein
MLLNDRLRQDAVGFADPLFEPVLVKVKVIPKFWNNSCFLFTFFFCLVTKETKKQGCMPIWTVLSLGFDPQS